MTQYFKLPDIASRLDKGICAVGPTTSRDLIPELTFSSLVHRLRPMCTMQHGCQQLCHVFGKLVA